LKRYLWKIPVIIALSAVVFFSKREVKEQFDFRTNDLIPYIQEMIPSAASVEEVNYINKWSLVYDKKMNIVGKFILTTPYCDNFTGYGGPLPLVIAADNDEKIIGLGILPNNETSSWIEGLKNIKFFGSWNGKTIAEVSELKVDAVTGATYTTSAVRDILIKRSAIYTGKIEYENTEQKVSLKWIENKLSPVLYFILLISLIGLFVNKLNRYRIYFQLASIIFFGILSGKFLSIYLFENISLNGIAVMSSYITVFLIGLSILITLIFNKHFYCYYICPFGGVQTLLGKIPVRKITPKASAVKFLRTMRLLIFVSVLVSIAAGLTLDLTQIEPFTVFIFSSASMTVIIGSLIIFIASIFIKNPWCIYFCPTGQFFDLLKDGVVKRN
jgi:NosR/NirI family transcriptional regulator, nitrous oxide reductase regulator